MTSIDAAPPSGSGGFFDQQGPITSAQVGENVSLVVTARQLGSTVTANGTITLSWNPTDFRLTSTGTDQTGSCKATPGNLACSYTDFGQRSKSVTYAFTTLNPDPNATVAVSAQTDGTAVKRTFALAITSPVSIAPAAPKGAGGWYDATGKAVTSAQVNQQVSLVVTAQQSGTPQADGTFALAYDPSVLTYQGNGDTTASCATGTSGTTATVTCSYTDLNHAAKSDAFRFLTKAATTKTTVSAKVTIAGATASAAFPLAITAGPSSSSGGQGTTTPPSTVPTSKAQCKRGGWQQLTTTTGRPFPNQGACVSYVVTTKHHGDSDDHHDADDHGHAPGQAPGHGQGVGVHLAGFFGFFHGHGPWWFQGRLAGHHGGHQGGHHGDHHGHHGDH